MSVLLDGLDLVLKPFLTGGHPGLEPGLSGSDKDVGYVVLGERALAVGAPEGDASPALFVRIGVFDGLLEELIVLVRFAASVTIPDLLVVDPSLTLLRSVA